MATSPSPKLTKVTGSTASQVQTLNSRLSALVPTLTTTLSPSTVYQPGIGTNYLDVFGTPATPFSVVNQIGVWTAPEIGGSTAAYEVQVECIAGGGGGGGGSASAGGGGGAGGEYACEPAYSVVPGKAYVWISGGGGTPGAANNSGFTQPGSPGALTQFDVAGVSLPTGVLAHGGAGGDSNAVGIGGTGGNGSGNTLHNNGGNGGTNLSGIASDNPVFLAGDSALWTPSTGIIYPAAWYILDDNTHATNKLSDAASGNDATVTSYSGGLGTGSPPANVTGAPIQVPTTTSSAGTWGDNPTIAGACVQFQIGSLNSASARIQCPSFTFAGTDLTISGWCKPDPSGVFGNPAQGMFCTVVANCNYTSGTPAGVAVFWRNLGTSASPNWSLNAYVSNGTTTYTAQYILGTITPGIWTYFTMTYASGSLKLYIDGVLENTVTTSAFTSVPAGKYGMCMGVNPASTQNYYFGYLSNVWFITNAASLTGIQQVYGLSPDLGGSGGGASGSPGGAGGTGGAPAGTGGGLGGTPVAVPASLTNVRTAGGAGELGANEGITGLGGTPGTGGGGGAAGNSSSVPVGGELVVPFTTAASYCGPDAGAAAGTIFNPGQQGTNGVLFSGGAGTDTASGSKNSLLIIPPGTFAGFRAGAGQNKVATQILLTFTNANPSSEITTILPIGYAYDTALPASYQAADLVQYVGYLAIPSGASTVTIDLTQSYFTQGVSGSYGSVPSAIVIGPGDATNLAANPFYAFNSATGTAFYSQVYGPGSVNDGGVSTAPYLTIVYTNGTGSIVTNSAPILLGSFGGEGLLKVSLVNNENTPVSGLQPYSVIDSGGNTFAAGYTGPITAWNPTASPMVPETWHSMVLENNWIQQTGAIACQYRMLSENSVEIVGCLNTNSGTVTSRVFFQLPVGYRPSTTSAGHPFMVACANSTADYFYGLSDNLGNLSVAGTAVTTSLQLYFWGIIDLAA